MALEMKGLKANMAALAKTVDRLNAKAIAANEKGSTLESHLGDLEGQLGQHVDDIEFVANKLGNSPNGLEDEPTEPFREPGAGGSTDNK